MQGKKQYSEQLFKTFQLSDRVPEENFYRRLKGLLDLNWLYKETKKYYGKDGVFKKSILKDGKIYDEHRFSKTK